MIYNWTSDLTGQLSALLCFLSCRTSTRVRLVTSHSSDSQCTHSIHTVTLHCYHCYHCCCNCCSIPHFIQLTHLIPLIPQQPSTKYNRAIMHSLMVLLMTVLLLLSTHRINTVLAA